MGSWLIGLYVDIIYVMAYKKDSIISVLNSYPNQLGRIHVDIQAQAIIPVEEESIIDTMARSKKNKKEDSRKISKSSSKGVDKIWKHMGLGHIDISYACIGYSLDGRPIINHDDFVNLLMNYGFLMQDILPFIDDFATHSTEDKNSPIVMFTANSAAIMSSIKPIA